MSIGEVIFKTCMTALIWVFATGAIATIWKL